MVDIFPFLFLFLLCLEWLAFDCAMHGHRHLGEGGKIQHGCGNMASTNND